MTKKFVLIIVVFSSVLMGAEKVTISGVILNQKDKPAKKAVIKLYNAKKEESGGKLLAFIY